jgi:hypothetical protein
MDRSGSSLCPVAGIPAVLLSDSYLVNYLVVRLYIIGFVFRVLNIQST